MSSLTPPRAGIPVGKVTINGVEYDAMIHPEWLRYLSFGLFERAGGVRGVGTTDLLESAFEDAGIEEAKAGLYRLDQDMSQAPQFLQQMQIEVLETIVSELREQVAGLLREVNELRQGTIL